MTSGGHAAVIVEGAPRETFRVRVEVVAHDVWVPPGRAVSAMVSVARCVKGRCSEPQAFRTHPSSTEFIVTEDGARATLVATAFGRPLRVEWTAAGDRAIDGDVYLYDPVLPSGQVRARVTRHDDASATVTLLGRSCPDHDAELTTEIVVDGVEGHATEAMPDSVPAQLRGLERARCRP